MARHAASIEKVEPHHALFQIGRDARGHWVVEDIRHRCGGVFRDRAQALRFVRDEGGEAAVAVLLVDPVATILPLRAAEAGERRS